MRGSRRLILSLAVMIAAVLLAGGVALAQASGGSGGTGGPETISSNTNGTDGNDTLKGTDNDDTINGYAGVDIISGMGGSDRIYGGRGNDKLYGVDEAQTDKPGNDTIDGNNGDDTIVGGKGADTLRGAEDNDTIYGMGGRDTLYGGSGNDTISAGPLEETDVDYIYGLEGNDTIYAANLPASRDVVNCDTGTDKVMADSLDEVGSGCEKVERIQEEEPDLADGTYELVPSPSSECDLGEGTFTIGNDPETGERGVRVELGGEVSPDSSGVQACEVKLDYETPVTAQGEVSTQSTNTRQYKGERPPQEDIDAVQEREQDAEEQQATSSSQSGDVTAQYAWRTNTARVRLQTVDPPRIVLAETLNRSTWWNNGYDVDYYSRGKNCWATPPGYFVTRWYNSYCNWGDWWYNYDSRRSWIGSDVGEAKYYNWGFADNNKSTRSYHFIRLWGYNNGGYEYRYWYSDYGEYYWLITSRVFATPAGSGVGT